MVVTGAGSGVGRRLAISFAEDGADVIGIDRARGTLSETASCCNRRMRFVVGDIAREADVESLFEEAARDGGHVDVLINNAAVYPRQDFLAGTHAEWVSAFPGRGGVAQSGLSCQST